MRKVLASLREFCGKVARRWYALGVGVIGGILGVVDTVAAAAAKPKTTPFSIPLWIWLPLLTGGFLVAILWAFHDVRMERDAIGAEMERRFDSLRYALGWDGVSASTYLHSDQSTADVEIGFELTNSSAEYLRYEVERATVVIQEQEAIQEDPAFTKGAIIPPGGKALSTCPPVRGVPVTWQTGSLKFTVKYGHPSQPWRFRKSQERRLRMRRPFDQPPGEGTLIAELTDDPEVEDI